ncbi:MAG: hypothetical protein V3V06_06780 [Dehalococcoidia bacterium]
MERERRQRAFATFERTTHVPVTVLSVVIVPLLVIPLAANLPDTAETVILALD